MKFWGFDFDQVLRQVIVWQSGQETVAQGSTHWGWVTHACVSKLTIIGSVDGLSPGRRQTIIWTNAGILLIQTMGNFNEILSKIHKFSNMKMQLKMSSAKWWQFHLSLNVLTSKIYYLEGWPVISRAKELAMLVNLSYLSTIIMTNTPLRYIFITIPIPITYQS